MPAMAPQAETLGTLNGNPGLDFKAKLEGFLENSDDELFSGNPFSNIITNCNYYDENSFVNSFSNSKYPLVLNLNIQYLNSKIEGLKAFLLSLECKNVIFDVISLQEISRIENASFFNISGYHPITYNCRKTLKGGGVGFYIKKELSFNVIDDLSIFQERIFESKCIEVEYPSGKVLFISIYRPPGNHPYLTNSQLLAAFQENLEFIFNKVGNRNCYILTDSNIGLLEIDRSSDSLL